MKVMIEKNVKTPLIISFIMQGLAMAIAIICVLTKKNFLPEDAALTGKQIIPVSVYIMGMGFLVQILFLFLIMGYEGRSRRLAAGIFTGVYCLCNIVSPWINQLILTIISRTGGAKEIAAHSLLSSTINILTSGLLVISTACFFIAVGRYGISINPEPIPSLDYPENQGSDPLN